MPAAPSYLLQVRSPTMHTPTSPHSPSSHSWKSVFLRRNPSSKKLPSNGVNGSALTLDTRTLSSQMNGNSKSPITPKTSLTPASVLSVDQRSSYNSSNTQSSDSNVGIHSRPYLTQAQRSYTSYQLQPGVTDELSAGLPKSRTRTRSERESHRAALGCPPQGGPQTASHSQSSFSPRSPLAHRQGGPSASKSMGALPRFIRRVASAPNAKDLFSPKLRSTSTTIKNGLLAPAENVPPIPVMPSTSSEQGTELGTDSLETSSSGSSRGRSRRPTRGHNSMPNQKTSDGQTEGPGKAPFRRTYSSNSIKIRSVSSNRTIDCLDFNHLCRWKLARRVS